jgi:hypothetical protein
MRIANIAFMVAFVYGNKDDYNINVIEVYFIVNLPNVFH